MKVLFMAAVAILISASTAGADTLPQRVEFPSADGHTMLVGYLYLPANQRGPARAVVMMHGRAGAYSSLANGRYDAATLSQRHRAWGELWASQGYVASWSMASGRAVTRTAFRASAMTCVLPNSTK